MPHGPLSSSLQRILLRTSLHRTATPLFNKRNLSLQVTRMLEVDETCFTGQMDIHRGVTVDSSLEPVMDNELFSKKLEASLKKWQEEKLRGVWFSVAMTHIHWIPILAENGFRIHHAKEDMISLCRWLPRDEQNRIPDYPHNMVGAGAVVINSENKILTICERYRDIPYWKLPGGYVNPGEDIVEAAMREVLEETNIKTEFVCMLSLRHSLKAAFGCSDLYFIVELKPLNEDIIKQDEEVEDCQWMKVDEFLLHPQVHENNRMFVRKCLESRVGGKCIGREFTYHPITKKPQALYSLTKRPDIVPREPQ